jgi:predicted TIM-barrel fold metal-dependent hydrolase
VKYPDRFVAAMACLPLNDVDATIKELDRAINELGFKGIQLYTDIKGKPLDLPEFMPIYEKMTGYDLPILLHPTGGRPGADYPTEKESKYYISSLFGREYDTSVAMTRLVFSGVMEKYPNLKIITHHFGGMIAFIEKRIDGMYDFHDKLLGNKYSQLSKRPVDYFRMFCCDTAYGSVLGLKCVCAFFGVNHVLFGTDMPFDSEMGNKKIRETSETIEQMDIAQSDKKKIFEGNARKLLHLTTR